MAYTAIDKSTDYFNTKLYTGNQTANTAITGVGFQPDWTWIKRRETNWHCLVDAVRGATKRLSSNVNNAEVTDATAVTSLDSDGFTIGIDSSGYTNQNGGTYVSWNWKANGAGSANTDGTTTSTVSANTTAGFSIVKYSGSSSAKTIGHGLGVVPEMIIVKTYSSGYEWAVYHKETGHGKNLYLDSTGGASNTTTFWNNTAPTNSVFSVGGQIIYTNYSGQDYIAYCFASKPGYSKFGSYTGNGNADGTFVYTGFKPAFIMIKRTDSTNNWKMIDNKRSPFNVVDKTINADSDGAEGTETNSDFLSNGFKLRRNGNDVNGSGASYIYMAFGQSLVGSSNVPCTAR